MPMDEAAWLRLRGEIAAIQLMMGMLLAKNAANKGGADYIRRLRTILRDALAARPAPAEPQRTMAEEAMNDCFEKIFAHAGSILEGDQGHAERH